VVARNDVMNKILVTAVCALSGVSGWLYWQLAQEKSTSQSLRKEMAGLRAETAAFKATNEAALELSRSHVERLNAGLSNTVRQLVGAQERIRQLELLAAAAPPPAETNAAAEPAGGVVPLPQAITLTTNTLGSPQRQVLISALYTPKGGALGTNLEFSGVYGRRVAFRDPTTNRRMAFDVDQLHPAVLAALGIDADAQKLAQARQEMAWKRMETASLAQAAAEAERRRERAAALAQARAETPLAPPADGVAPNLPPEQPGPAGPGFFPDQPWDAPPPQPWLPPQ